MASATISIVRMWETPVSTISKLSISGTDVSGFMLERPGPDTITSNLRLRIPEGVYNLKWHNSGKHSIAKHNPVPLLYNATVPVSRYILIHNGNVASDSDGCLLIGSLKTQNRVLSSVPKLLELKGFLQEVGIENVKVRITSCYSLCR